MSDMLAEKAVAFVQRRQSRRRFLATCGKVAIALGLALARAHVAPRRAYAGACCNGPPCMGCPPTPGCPPTTTVYGVPYVCCDTGYAGATDTLHQCWVCDTGITGLCECEYDTGQGCP